MTLVRLATLALSCLAFVACSAAPVVTVLQHVETVVCFEHPELGHVCVKLFGGEPQWFKVQPGVELTPELRAHLIEWLEAELAKRA